uniref:alpha-N-acetylgalactosaminide alpha-2,6-sialyltransferase 1 isoform X1 n=1 Tax=Podarcis muralis TaxID=64176 RepID=UPI0010A0385F|nr:alpha-N-acetylgalactosaminide alpha-2,6-sialyltransferase 1 isoform X1 [Podarcis muralis]
MRSIRRWCPRGTRLLLIGFLFLVLSFAAYIGFTEKYPYSQFPYFRRAGSMPQTDTRPATPEVMTANRETPRPLSIILGPSSSPLEQDAVKRLANGGNTMDTREKHVEATSPSDSTEKQARERGVIAANPKQVVEKLRPTANENQAKHKTVTTAAGQNHAGGLNATPTVYKKKREKHVTSTSSPKEEKNKSEHKGNERAEAKYEAPASNQKLDEERGAKTASNQNATPRPTASHTKGKVSREMDVAKKNQSLVDSLSVVADHNVSIPRPGAQQVTHPVPAPTPKKRLKASDFKSEPHWDFDDQYLLDNSTPASSCPDSLRVKAAKSDWLKDLFLPNLTLFMDKTHFSDSEWERLDHFGPPYGFMELNYSCMDFLQSDVYKCENGSISEAKPKTTWQTLKCSDSVLFLCLTSILRPNQFRDVHVYCLPFILNKDAFCLSVVKQVITMLPPKPYHQILFARNSSQTSRCIRCAVVGNGGILNNSKMGQEIDSHDYVFRVSGAVVKGFEEDVGTRTSFYGFTAYSLVSSVSILGNRGFKKIPVGKEIKYLHFLEGPRDYEWLKALLLNTRVRKGFLDGYGPYPRDKFGSNFTLDNYFVIHPDFLRYMKNRFLRSKSLDKSYWRIYRPTTGAFLLLTALHLCDQVSAYGYITEGYQKYSDHYYDQKWHRLVFYSNHDFDLERRTWKKLHDSGIMKLYQRS